MINDLIERLVKVKKTGKGYQARCLPMMTAGLP